jgi:uncharacterized protein YecE (DUF72 family)
MAKSLIGTSGWNYKHWHRGEFYPTQLEPPQWLQFFSHQFETVEINSSFYRLPSEAAFQHWRSQVPRQFIFAVKASRFLTHIKRLKDPKEPLALFFSRAKHLKDRLGCLPASPFRSRRWRKLLKRRVGSRCGKYSRVVEVRTRCLHVLQ